MEFLIEYGLFLAKAVTFVVAIGIIIGLAVSAANQKGGHGEKGHITVTNLNDRFESMHHALKGMVVDEALLKEEDKQKKKDEKAKKKEEKAKAKALKKRLKLESSSKSNQKESSEAEDDSKKADSDKEHKLERKKRVYVLSFDGDIKASATDALRESITAVLSLAESHDEVVLKLESPGGVVHGYGLAASQLDRFVQKKIPLTVCVDKVAASGGYMMACVADKILSAPFAILGSIGVVAQLPNFNKILKKHDVDYDIFTAGKYKRTVTMLGENTEEGRKKFMEDLEDTHVLFKEFIAEHRPQVDLEDVATGEIWFGRRALDKNLIDGIITSDQYLADLHPEADILAVDYEFKKSFQERLGVGVSAALESSFNRLLSQLNFRYWAK